MSLLTKNNTLYCKHDAQYSRTYLISIVICTYKRQNFLEKCIHSCLNQRDIADCKIEIVIVDNDYEKSARQTVSFFQSQAGIPIRYVQENVANISMARNRGVVESRSVYIAFIDDDFILPNTWLCAVLAAINTFQPDVIIGDVYPSFEGDPVLNPAITKAFTRQAPEAEGRLAIRQDGYIPGARSGNAILRRTCLGSEAGWFDPQFGRSGGEDSDFFMRLGRHKPLIIRSSDAFVFDFVPRSRQSEDYVVARAKREGRNYARVVQKNAAYSWLRSIDMIIRGLIQSAVYSALLTMSPFAQSEQRLRWRILRGLALGKALLAGRSRDEPYR